MCPLFKVRVFWVNTVSGAASAVQRLQTLRLVGRRKHTGTLIRQSVIILSRGTGILERELCGAGTKPVGDNASLQLFIHSFYNCFFNFSSLAC